MKLLSLLLCLFALVSTNLFANSWHPKDQGRFEISANPMQNGDAFEFGLSSSSLFKFKESSRHYWSIFGTLGTLTTSNVLLKDETKVEEIISPELILGIQAHANFLKDFLFQYGKIALDAVFYDSKLRKSAATGLLLESGIEFKSDIEKISFHLGFRWRLGLPTANEISGETDPFEGLSMIFGTRFFF
jgi:hypothetical protein